MVGVPRSSGCRICVQRRVKCDGARPICNNCRKGNRPCPGYDSGVKFQDEGPKIREKYRKGEKPCASFEGSDDALTRALTPSSKSASSPGTPGSEEWNSLGLDIDRSKRPDGLPLFAFVEGKTQAYRDLDLLQLLWKESAFGSFDADSASAQLPFTLSIPVLSPNAQQLQLLSNFTHSITPPEVRFLPKAMRAQATWLSHLPGISGTSSLLDSAIRAVTLVHIGRIHNNTAFLVESRPYYGKALRLLGTAIADKEMGMDNKTLCATILLSFYEMFASSDDASWVRHAGGAGALMRMRGAERHRHGFDRDIFLAYRHTLIIEALSNDVPSFLDEPKWRQLTGEIYSDLVQSNLIPPDRRGIFDVAEEFYSQMASISVAAANAHAIRAEMTQTGLVDEGEVLVVYQELQSLHDALQVLFKRWQKILESAGRWPSLRPAPDPVVPHQYQYMNVFIASMNIGFLTTLMLTNSSMYGLLTKLGLPTTTCISENEIYAMESCQSVDFMLTSSFLGPFFTIYALRYVFRIFKDGDIRKDWAVCKLIEIGDRRMLFAKGAIYGTPDGGCELPEQFFEASRQRLIEYNLAHRLKQDVVAGT